MRRVWIGREGSRKMKKVGNISEKWPDTGI